jgi:indolepyruvate ferredoxin oxidoreductase
VLRHANLAGTSRHGGVLAIAGDDHGAQSSTTAHQSEQIFEAAMMPLLNPSTVQDYLDLGLFGFALSRYSGCWIGFKALSETVDSSASVHVDPARVNIVLPEELEMPPGGLHIRWPAGAMDWALDQEARMHGPKMAAVHAFARINDIDRTVIDPPQARLGITAAGKAWLDVRQALVELGLTECDVAALGIRLHKVALAWPLEPSKARRFAQGLEEILVVEEKRGFIEHQLVRLLYNTEAAGRPRVVGKADENAAPLLPSTGELTPTMVARAIVTRLERLGADIKPLAQRVARLESFEQRSTPSINIRRTPFFCSGCPHNTSTRLPQGSRAMAGIGCHSMALFMPGRETATLTQMGGEGANWIGQAPFTREKHVFQNLGDGTYAHSGLMAMRAAAAAGVNITYKILYNDAVAMTGGQPVEGKLTVAQIAHQVMCEGARRVVIVTGEPEKKYAGLPGGVDVRDRDELDAVQRALRETPGLTVLIYDQTCAAEKRRRRKRGLLPDPDARIFINDAVCEGCGDCSVQSNCIAVEPLETEFGRKRRIDQGSCNKDFSCLKGFCPSFVTVHGATPRKLQDPAKIEEDVVRNLPHPLAQTLDRPYGILIAGVGGSGVITLGALLGMAAHMEGKACTVLDVTGLAQKNGAVTSHVRLAQRPEDLHAVRIAAGGANLLLGCDMVVAAAPPSLQRIETGITRAIVNTHVAPTAQFVLDQEINFELASMQRALRAAVGSNGIELIDASALTTALLGDALASNLFMLGYGFQKGLVPLSLAAIERAIALNGVAPEMNLRAFAWGRLAAHDPARLEARVRPLVLEPAPVAHDMAALVERRVAILTDYQDAAYARRYRELVQQIAAVEKSRVPGRSDLAEAAARNLFKLMAYKDEYEVARLYANGEFLEKLHRQFEGDLRLEFHLAAPLVARRDAVTGLPRKRAFGAWMLKLFKLIARLRRLRGTPFDVFGYSAQRRRERELIREYEGVLGELAAALDPENHALAVEIASLPEQIKGFGHVKACNIERVKAHEGELLVLFRGVGRTASAA